MPDKRPELEAKASDSSATGGPNEINYAQLFEEELLKVCFSQFLLAFTLLPGHKQEKSAGSTGRNGGPSPAEYNYARLVGWVMKTSLVSLICCDFDFSLSFTSFLFFCGTHNIPGVNPSKDDDYLCTGVSIGDLSPDKVK